MGMLGLSFIAQAYQQSQSRSRLKHIRQGLRTQQVGGTLTKDEQELLKGLSSQIRVSRARTRRTCPECARKMVEVVLNDVVLDCCSACRGIWFDPGELKVFSGRSRDVPSAHLQSRESKYCCAVCGEVMHEYVFLQPYNLLVDQCRRGHGVYLEERELERVFKLT